MTSSTHPPLDPRATHPGTETEVDRALRVAIEGRSLAQEHVEVLAGQDTRIGALEQLVGKLPSALPGAKGSGLAQHLVDLGGKVDALTLTLNATIAALDADRLARAAEELRRATDTAKRREPWSRVGWLAAGAAIATIVGAAIVGALGWLSGLHH